MHKKYINYDLPIVVDYIPDDGKLCGNCKFMNVCPYDYACNTLSRVQEYENMDNDRSNLRDE